MIKEYISSYKKTATFETIQAGILNNQLCEVLIGAASYKITSKYENTIPSQILIGLHILIIEKKINNDEIDKAFRNVEITSDTICLMLDYLDKYLVYRVSHHELKIEFQYLLPKLKSYKELLNSPCAINLLDSISNKLSVKNS